MANSHDWSLIYQLDHLLFLNSTSTVQKWRKISLVFCDFFHLGFWGDLKILMIIPVQRWQQWKHSPGMKLVPGCFHLFCLPEQNNTLFNQAKLNTRFILFGRFEIIIKRLMRNSDDNCEAGAQSGRQLPFHWTQEHFGRFADSRQFGRLQSSTFPCVSSNCSYLRIRNHIGCTLVGL